MSFVARGGLVRRHAGDVTRTVVGSGAEGSSISTETVPVTEYVPKTCYDTRWVEVATFSMTGRAFRTGEEP